jgi:hypothetical protein
VVYTYYFLDAIFRWIFSNLITSKEINSARIWVDMFFNDQNSIDILLELNEADQQYRNASLHVVLGTRGWFTRAWCLHELMTRKLAGKTSILLGVVGRQGKHIQKISTSFTASLKWLLQRSFQSNERVLFQRQGRNSEAYRDHRGCSHLQPFRLAPYLRALPHLFRHHGVRGSRDDPCCPEPLTGS